MRIKQFVEVYEKAAVNEIDVVIENKGQTNNDNNVLRVMCTNARSLSSKFCELMAIISRDKLDLVAITETWFKDSNEWEISIPGYTLYRKDRVERRGGGVAIYVKESLKASLIQNTCKELETLWVCMQTKEGSIIRIGVIYRPPGHSEDYDIKMVDEITQMAVKGDIVVMGDFNMPDVDWNIPSALTCKSKNIVEALTGAALAQMVKTPTRGENILDLVFTNGNRVSEVKVGENLGCSDHLCLWFDVKTDCEQSHTTTKVLDFRKTNFNEMGKYLNNELKGRDKMAGASAQWTVLKKAILKATGLYARQITKGKRKKKPLWFSNDVRAIVNEKKSAYRRYKESGSIADREVYKKRQKEAKQIIYAAKASKEEEIAKSVKKGDKTFFRYINDRKKKNCSITKLSTGDNTYIEGNKEIANHLNSYFCSVFSEGSLQYNTMDGYSIASSCRDSAPVISEADVLEELERLKINKAMGPDGIHPRVLKELRSVIATPLTDLFNQSLLTGDVPDDWRMANVVPIHKKGSREEAGNYRPVSLTSVIVKMMESLLKKRINQHLKTNNLLDPNQHGFTEGKSCQTNLIDFFDYVTKGLDEGGAMDIAYLDFSKAFDTVPHKELIDKLVKFGLNPWIVQWICSWLKHRYQRVVVNGEYSEQSLVTSGVPQGSVLGPILFNIFVSDIGEGLVGKVCLFADDTKVCNRVDIPGGVCNMANDLALLDKWSKQWKLQFNVSKCKIMHLGKRNPQSEYCIGSSVLAKTSEEKDLGVVISDSLKMGEQCSQAVGKASRMLGCIARGITSRKREVVIPLYGALVRPHLEYCVQFWRPHLQKDIDKVERVQRRATKMVESLKHKTYQERLNELNLYSLEDRRVRGDMIETFKYVKGLNKIQEGSVFNRKVNTRTRGHNLRLVGGKIRSNVRKYYFTERVVDAWNKLPADVVGKSTVTEFKHAWDKHISILR